MEKREYIKIPKSTPIPNSIVELKKFDDEFWKQNIFSYLLSFYRNYDKKQLSCKIEVERQNTKRQENCIATYIRRYLKKDKLFSQHFDVSGEVKNDDSDKEGFYDITISNTYWVKKEDSTKKSMFHFECKNLNQTQDLVNKYVAYNKGHKKYDGGVYRYFNGKYAQNQTFGGMIGFVLEGDILEIKEKIITKLKNKFDTTPEGDLLNIIDNSIEDNDFTFDSQHNRKNDEFLIHHILFNFS